MVSALAFCATAVATLFAQATLVRYTRFRRPHEMAWTVALSMFALASVALALGTSTGWDNGTFRVFYLFGAILNVPWLALGTVYLLAGATAGRRVQWALVLFTGLAAGAMLTAPMEPVTGSVAIPVGKDVLGGFPRILAAAGSGLGAIVIIGGAVTSAVRFVRRRTEPGMAHLAAANALIALGTVVLSSGGLTQGVVGHDEAFTLSLALGISVIYAGFLVSLVSVSTARSPVSRTTRAPRAAVGDRAPA